MQISNKRPPRYIGRRLDLEAHKESPLVKDYINNAVLFHIDSHLVKYKFMPKYSSYNFVVVNNNKRVGYLIKGHFIYTYEVKNDSNKFTAI